ncbi:hypothetical protein PCS_01842 [Desulfocurvibacter africanus PCS]|uniref:Uncharacterized protein n=1 Tax=Desulfocurvibacter africanus PCS TaxID=1262666 RepID=M5PTG0_DESAF|nr:hypothetical protein [Desulfocurvibacter africanus]EMG37330.1 hypothetical protein PCS_01842 [Desulfocurvibacter africanus PCS]
MNIDVRARIWRAIRASSPGWTMGDLMRIAEATADEVSDYCRFLESAGFIKSHGLGAWRVTQAARSTLAAPSPDGQERISLDLVLDTASNELRLLRESTPGAWARVQKTLTRPDQQLLRGARTDTACDRMWAGVRELRKFTRKQLGQATGCAHGAVVDYIRLLCLAGLAIEAGQASQEKVYELKQDPGPERPVIRETIRRKRRKAK